MGQPSHKSPLYTHGCFLQPPSFFVAYLKFRQPIHKLVEHADDQTRAVTPRHSPALAEFVPQRDFNNFGLPWLWSQIRDDCFDCSLRHCVARLSSRRVGQVVGSVGIIRCRRSWSIPASGSSAVTNRFTLASSWRFIDALSLAIRSFRLREPP